LSTSKNTLGREKLRWGSEAGILRFLQMCPALYLLVSMVHFQARNLAHLIRDLQKFTLLFKGKLQWIGRLSG
jgi:hypothetical protein